jgi:hypothetical protein
LILLGRKAFEPPLINMPVSGGVAVERFSALSKEQAKAVLVFLKYMSGIRECDNTAAQRAIASFWDKFE